jgi:heme-degrading monooxygenase HmoA
MWAQIVKSRLKAGSEEEFQRLGDEPGPQRPGLVRSLILRDQNDRRQIYSVIVFESEEIAREFEHTPETQAFVARIQSVMEGTPEYVDCEVVVDRGQ